MRVPGRVVRALLALGAITLAEPRVLPDAEPAPALADPTLASGSAWLAWGTAFAGLGLTGGTATYLALQGRSARRSRETSRERELAETRRQVAEAVRNAEDRQRDAAAEADSRRELERLICDLHDGIAGIAANLSMTAGLALETSNQSQRTTLLSSIRDLADEARQEIRAMVQFLGANERDWGLLGVGVRQYAQEFLKPRGVEFAWKGEGLDGVPPPTPAQYVGLYRIFKEAAGNVLKHAQARRFEARLSFGAEALCFELWDDGVGLKPEHRRGYGLQRMERRIRELGGRMEVRSSPGVRLRFDLPLAFRPAAAGRGLPMERRAEAGT